LAGLTLFGQLPRGRASDALDVEELVCELLDRVLRAGLS
jgi:hypothetical protein